jgi:hypothetical protein
MHHKRSDVILIGFSLDVWYCQDVVACGPALTSCSVKSPSVGQRDATAVDGPFLMMRCAKTDFARQRFARTPGLYWQHVWLVWWACKQCDCCVFAHQHWHSVPCVAERCRHISNAGVHRTVAISLSSAAEQRSGPGTLASLPIAYLSVCCWQIHVVCLLPVVLQCTLGCVCGIRRPAASVGSQHWLQLLC